MKRLLLITFLVVSIPNLAHTDVLIPIKAEYKNKIVYTDDASADVSKLERDCTRREGSFNTCGSVCDESLGETVCVDVCAFTCEFSQDNQEEITQEMLGICEVDSDCIVVNYNHCCGSSKKAINKKYLEEYQKHPEWQEFFDDNTCSVIGMCQDDSAVTQSKCQLADRSIKRCRLLLRVSERE